MVSFVIFAAGVAVGIGVYKLYDLLKHNSENLSTKYTSHDGVKINKPQIETNVINDKCATSFDISPLAPIMHEYGVDITAANCLYILCSKIKSNTYKKLLDDVVEKTKTGEELIAFINDARIETFAFPEEINTSRRHNIPISTIDQLLADSSIALINNNEDPKIKVQTLINVAFASAIERLKKNFGVEFSKLIKAYEKKVNLEPYYNDLIKEIEVSRDFLKS